MHLNSPSQHREEYLRKKRKKRLIKWGVALCIFFSIAGALSYISYRPSLRISQVEFSGGVLLTFEDIETETLSYLEGAYFWVAPRNNAFLYPKKSLRAHLQETFRRIDTIEVELKNPKTLSVSISERKPYAMWCKELPESEDRTCYFMDRNSTIFAEAPQFSGDAYMKYYGPLGGETVIGTEYMASTTQFLELSEFVERIKNMSLRPQYVVAKEEGEFLLRIRGGGDIYFNNKEPFLKAGDNLEELLRTPALAKNSSGTLPIEYIDLRFGNKLFYKLK